MEQYASPYVYCGNNPMLFVDPNGMFALNHIEVKKIESEEDGEDKYEVVGGEVNDDLNIYVVDEQGNRLSNDDGSTQILGQMFTKYSFFNTDDDPMIGSVIDMKDMSGQRFFDNTIKNIGLLEYMNNAKSKEKYDFKTTNGIKYNANLDVARGMPFEGKIASARDIGNFSARYVAGDYGLPWFWVEKEFNKLQGGQEPPVSAIPQKMGHSASHSNLKLMKLMIYLDIYEKSKNRGNLYDFTRLRR